MQVFPMRYLRVFTPEELELHIRGDMEPWNMETLRASIKPDHGYNEVGDMRLCTCVCVCVCVTYTHARTHAVCVFVCVWHACVHRKHT